MKLWLRGCNLLTTFKRNISKFLPLLLTLLLILFIMEGTFRSISWLLLLIYLGYRVYQGVKTLDKVGAIDQLGEALFKREKKR